MRFDIGRIANTPNLRLIFVSSSYRAQEIRFELFSIQEKIGQAKGLTKSPQSTQSSVLSGYSVAPDSLILPEARKVV